VEHPLSASPVTDLTEAETQRRISAILASPTYRLAEEDTSFMESEAARAARLAQEFMRADVYLRRHRVRSTVVVFGGARILSPEAARANLGAAGEDAARQAQARTALDYSRYYEEARLLGAALTCICPHPEGHEFVVATGGGPGIMEAANRGAAEAGAPNIGFNIRLPEEQLPNPWVTPTLAFRFHYFALRKMHFLLRARALVAFPGGYGTLDELFESLNLVQTRVIAPIPIVLVGREHWRRVVDFDYLLSQGLISSADRELFTVVDSAADAVRRICQFHGLS